MVFCFISTIPKEGRLTEGLVASLAYSCKKPSLGLKYLEGLHYVFFIFKNILQLNTKSLWEKWKPPDSSELDRLRFLSINTPSPFLIGLTTKTVGDFRFMQAFV